MSVKLYYDSFLIECDEVEILRYNVKENCIRIQYDNLDNFHKQLKENKLDFFNITTSDNSNSFLLEAGGGKIEYNTYNKRIRIKHPELIYKSIAEYYGHKTEEGHLNESQQRYLWKICE